MESIVSFLRKLLNYFKTIDGIIHLAVLIVAAVLAYLSIRANELIQYLQASIAILTILAVGQLITDHSSTIRDNKLDDVIRKIDTLTSGKSSADSFFIDRENLDNPGKLFENAKTLDLMGPSLNFIAIHHNPKLLELTESGAHIRILISNPNNKALQEAITRKVTEAGDAKKHIQIVNTSISHLKPLAGTHQRGGTLEVRFSDDFPSFSYIGINTNSATQSVNAFIKIEFYLNQSPLAHSPNFYLYSAKEPVSFEKFKAQFELLWNKGINLP